MAHPQDASRVQKLEKAAVLMRRLMGYMTPSREDWADEDKPAKTWDELEALLDEIH